MAPIVNWARCKIEIYERPIGLLDDHFRTGWVVIRSATSQSFTNNGGLVGDLGTMTVMESGTSDGCGYEKGSLSLSTDTYKKFRARLRSGGGYYPKFMIYVKFSDASDIFIGWTDAPAEMTTYTLSLPTGKTVIAIQLFARAGGGANNQKASIVFDYVAIIKSDPITPDEEVENLDVELCATTSISGFKFTLLNDKGVYTEKPSVGDLVMIYLAAPDEALDQKLSSGYITDKEPAGDPDNPTVTITSADLGQIFNDRTFTKKYTSATLISQIVKDIRDQELTELTRFSVEDTDNSITPEFNEEGVFNLLRKLADASRKGTVYGYDFYVDPAGDIHFVPNPRYTCGEKVYAGIFYDDFRGNMDRWNTVSGTWLIENEELKQSNTATEAFIFAGRTAWANYTAEAKVKIVSEGTGGRNSGLIFRATDQNNLYLFTLSRDQNKVFLYKRVAGTWTELSSTPFSVQLNTTYRLRVEVLGSGMRCYVDDSLKIEAIDNQFSTGKIGFRTLNVHAGFDDVQVEDLGQAALRFDGLDDYIKIDSLNNLGISDQMTFKVLYRKSSHTSGYEALVYKGKPTDSNMQFYIVKAQTTNKVRFATKKDETWYSAESNFALYSDGQWHSLGVVFSGGNVSFYSEGVHDVTKSLGTTTLPNPTSQDMTMGRSTTNEHPFLGEMDEPHLLKVAQTAQEMAEYHRGRRQDPDGNTVGLWHLDEGQGTTIKDESSQNNHGTLYSPIWVPGFPFPIQKHNIKQIGWKESLEDVANNIKLLIRAGEYSPHDKDSWTENTSGWSSPQTQVTFSPDGTDKKVGNNSIKAEWSSDPGLKVQLIKSVNADITFFEKVKFWDKWSVTGPVDWWVVRLYTKSGDFTTDYYERKLNVGQTAPASKPWSNEEVQNISDFTKVGNPSNIVVSIEIALENNSVNISTGYLKVDGLHFALAPITKTATDADSQGKYGVKKRNFEDFTITDQTFAQYLANALCQQLKNPIKHVSVTVPGKAQEGYRPPAQVLLSSSKDNIRHEYFKIIKARHHYTLQREEAPLYTCHLDLIAAKKTDGTYEIPITQEPQSIRAFKPNVELAQRLNVVARKGYYWY